MGYLSSFSSVALFGSVVRGDNDLLSDRDLLVVSEQEPCPHAINEIRSQGFSPSAYSWRGLELLFKNSALFLMHLKLESKILKDENSKLENFLGRYEPSGDYSININQSIELAALTTGVPDDPVAKLWAADVLAVALRNYLVARAAQNGRYIFSYNSLIDFYQTNYGPEKKSSQYY